MGKAERFRDLVLGNEEKFALEERIFNAILFASAIAAFLLFISDIVQLLKPSIYLFSFFSTILLSFFNLYARKKQKPRYLVLPYSFFLVFVFIYVWYNNGGIEGTALYYLFPMVIIVPLFLRGNYRFIIFFIILLIALVLLLIEIRDPGFVLIIEKESIRKIDNFVSAILVTSTILLTLVIILNSYSRQHQKVINLNQSKDKINSIIAHDLRNPLGTLTGLAMVLKENWNTMPSANREKIIDSIVRSSEQTYNLLENLLQWARSESGMLRIQKEKLEISKQIFHAISLMSEEIQAKKQELKNDVDSNLCILADRNMLETVFRNLLSNAIKFTPEQGKIEISIKKTPNKKVKISFKDSGKGIDPKDI